MSSLQNVIQNKEIISTETESYLCTSSDHIIAYHQTSIFLLIKSVCLCIGYVMVLAVRSLQRWPLWGEAGVNMLIPEAPTTHHRAQLSPQPWCSSLGEKATKVEKAWRKNWEKQRCKHHGHYLVRGEDRARASGCFLKEPWPVKRTHTGTGELREEETAEMSCHRVTMTPMPPVPLGAEVGGVGNEVKPAKKQCGPGEGIVWILSFVFHHLNLL